MIEGITDFETELKEGIVKLNSRGQALRGKIQASAHSRSPAVLSNLTTDLVKLHAQSEAWTRMVGGLRDDDLTAQEVLDWIARDCDRFSVSEGLSTEKLIEHGAWTRAHVTLKEFSLLHEKIKPGDDEKQMPLYEQETPEVGAL